MPNDVLKERRVESLTVSCGAALAAASVLGREYSLPLLSKLVDQPVDVPLGQMDQAVRAGVTAEATPAGDHYRFVRDLVRETLYRSLPASERIRMHPPRG